MTHDLFVMQIPILEKIVRTLLVYVLIVVLFRLTGKRGLAGLSTFDVVVMFLLSNVVQNAIIGSDNSLLGGVLGAATLVLVNTVVNRLTVSNAATARLLEGTPTTIIDDGHLDQHAIRRLGLRASEVEHAVRLQNGDQLSDVRRGRLEPGGQLILTLKASEQPATHADVTRLMARLDAIEQRLSR